MALPSVRRPPRIRRGSVPAVVLIGLLATAAGAEAKSAKETTDRDVRRQLERIVAADGGPPGAIATLFRNGRTTVLSTGRADVRRKGAPRARDHMRIASVSKAFSGAVALRLVQDGRLGLDDTIGQRRPDLPATWAAVTVRQLLNHTSGVPDYTRTEAFQRQFQTAPHAVIRPLTLIGWVADEPLEFAPGTRYRYSNSDNIVVALIAEAVTGKRYEQLLREIVFEPAKLRRTRLSTKLAVPRPTIRGYVVEPGEKPEDVTTALSPSGAWASGGIVSTPGDLGRFVRHDLGRTFFGAAEQREQLRFRPGASSPPGPGRNAAGLALFRYQTRCGTVYGHTGSFPGYTQWIAATRDGKRSVTTTFNASDPSDRVLRQIRRAQESAVCALLGR
ncbi:MAG: beta-lactamase family protein [Patulibacter sp.]|nr:beta-lactamase family protein [Patulibacter sp.]